MHKKKELKNDPFFFLQSLVLNTLEKYKTLNVQDYSIYEGMVCLPFYDTTVGLEPAGQLWSAVWYNVLWTIHNKRLDEEYTILWVIKHETCHETFGSTRVNNCKSTHLPQLHKTRLHFAFSHHIKSWVMHFQVFIRKYFEIILVKQIAIYAMAFFKFF